MHPLATHAAVQTLRSGGNAVDAAVALGLAISVTSHDWSGIAGDSAWLIYTAKTGEFHYLDGYSTCPESTTAALLREHFGLTGKTDAHAFQEEPAESRHCGVITSTVPGTPAAWHELSQRFGRLPFGQLCEPAIALAEDGFPINQYFSDSLAAAAQKLLPFESTRRIVCNANGSLLVAGDTLKQHDLASTLRQLAAHGRAGFYDGETARLLTEYCSMHGGQISSQDLARYRPVWRPVLRGSYRAFDVVVTSPPTAGVHVLQALNVLEGFDLAGFGYHTFQSLHVLIEALRLALCDRRMVGGDPDFLEMDVERLMDKQYASELRTRIRPDHVLEQSPGAFAGSSTTHFVVADSEGNLVCATQTIGSRFGCGEVIEGTGMFMNDRTWWMGLDEGPNVVAPGHRANIGHAPTILLSDGRPYVALGSPGGFGIVQYVVQVIVNMIDYGLDIQSAIEAPRFRIEDLKGTVGLEKRISKPVIQALAALGHGVLELPEWTDRVGGVEAVYLDHATSNMLGGYDPRRNSMAAAI
jgi:gamma-glutamyltranspeptidase/glutathione hydrolase